MQVKEVILVIDDEIDLGEFIVELLTPHFEKVLFATDATSALAIIESGDISLILSDIRMPGLSGPDLVTKVRADGVLTPIIFLSGFVDKEVALQALRLGVQDVLDKPFEEGTLVATIRKVLDFEKRRVQYYQDLHSIEASSEKLSKQRKMMGLMLVSNSKKG